MIDNSKTERLLKTAKGQIDGILKMIAENRECIEISSQLAATQSILKKVNVSILSNHISHCVKETFESENEGAKQQKIKEITDLLNTILK